MSGADDSMQALFGEVEAACSRHCDLVHGPDTFSMAEDVMALMEPILRERDQLRADQARSQALRDRALAALAAQGGAWVPSRGESR